MLKLIKIYLLKIKNVCGNYKKSEVKKSIKKIYIYKKIKINL